jgi:glyoxylate/hydroxypyruvate reductase A
MILLVKSGGEAAMPEWRAAFAACAPGLDVRWWNDPTVPAEEVAYAFVWEPEPGRLASYPNLRLICSTGAGVDHILADPHLPRHLGIVRMGGEETVQRMREYVAFAALALLRDARRMALNQAARRWEDFNAAHSACDVRAGVLGLGQLGAAAAATLRDLGFRTAGWARSQRALPGIECFAGDAALPAFLARTDLLVCLLPGTPQTSGILDARRLAMLPAGAGVVNVGRGTHLVADDLLAALDSGHLSGAVLDVFETEPLPPEHSFWTHPKVIVTPHNASMSSRPARARYVAAAIAAFERGETPSNLYDPVRGY